MCVDDAADASLFLMQNYNSNEPVNIGVGEDLTIRELAERVKQVVGFEGEIAFDTSRPDGALQKLLDISRLREMGWKAQTPLIEGVAKAYEWYLQSLPRVR
jgi:GDP-L-fucose synthase